ncbi:MAG: MT-A70 family methyltransferase, partial [Sulfuricaulis sp.]|uniref:MT-A70 family methyltransferase n=1 Tax=Sulfuricaulis sp. TaxID=2003553 RepID=UPI0025E3383F
MRYATIVADPPWEVKAGPLCGRMGFGDATGASRPLSYPSMSVAQISALPISALAADDAHLYLWTINKYIEASFAVARAWGFQYSTLLTWAKNPMGGGLGGAYGISTEYVLFCRRGSLSSLGRTNTTWFNWKRPYDERGKPKHSAKPPEFQAMVERMSPGPYLELFARSGRAGWDAWGNEHRTKDF